MIEIKQIMPTEGWYARYEREDHYEFVRLIGWALVTENLRNGSAVEFITGVAPVNDGLVILIEDGEAETVYHPEWDKQWVYSHSATGEDAVTNKSML